MVVNFRQDHLVRKKGFSIVVTSYSSYGDFFQKAKIIELVIAEPRVGLLPRELMQRLETSPELSR